MTKSRGPRTEPWGHHRGKYVGRRNKQPNTAGSVLLPPL